MTHTPGGGFALRLAGHGRPQYAQVARGAGILAPLAGEDHARLYQDQVVETRTRPSKKLVTWARERMVTAGSSTRSLDVRLQVARLALRAAGQQGPGVREHDRVTRGEYRRVRRRRRVVVSYAGLPGTPRCARGRNAETPRYVELSHVLRVLYLQVVQGFQDHWLTWRDCRDSSRCACLRNPRRHQDTELRFRPFPWMNYPALRRRGQWRFTRQVHGVSLSLREDCPPERGQTGRVTSPIRAYTPAGVRRPVRSPSGSGEDHSGNFG
jgi:hypothetical protein